MESWPGEHGLPISTKKASPKVDDGLTLQFITTTGKEAAEKPDPDSRRLVRAQARRSARRSAVWVSASSSNSATWSGNTLPGSKQSYTSRFKLASWQSRKNKKKTAAAGQSVILPKVPGFTLSEDGSVPLNFVVEVGPINVLPIPLIPSTEEILHFYHFEFQTNSFALNPEGNWYGIARTDGALLHTLLTTVAELQGVQLGINNQAAVVYHRSEAVRLINERLTHEPGQLSDLLITAVASLVIAEAIQSNYEIAKIHMRGLVKMLELRGGLAGFNHCQVLQRVIAWADFCFSSTWRMPLAFPLLPGLSRSLPTSDWFISEMVLQYKLFGPSDISEPSLSVLKVLTLLQSISRTISVFPNVGGDRVVISNSIYVAEHQLLSLTFPRGDPAATGLDISECLRIAALLYLHLAIREWPLRAQRNHRLVESLLRSLPHDRDLSTLVAPEMGLYLLLWAHFVTAAAAIEPQSRAFFAARVSQVTAAARITNYADFERGLKTVAWIDPFCRLRCIELWDEIWLDPPPDLVLPSVNVSNCIDLGVSEFATVQ